MKDEEEQEFEQSGAIAASVTVLIFIVLKTSHAGWATVFIFYTFAPL